MISSYGDQDRCPLTAPTRERPDQAILIQPSDGEKELSKNPALKVQVTDPNNDTMNVSFYDVSDNFLIGIDANVSNSGVASVIWSGLSYHTSYGWYVVVNDSRHLTRSENWSFTTKSRPSSGEHYSPPPSPIEEKVTSKEEVEDLFNISLEYNFSAYDMDGDGIVDAFTDPNGVLNSERLTNISGNVSFLISVNGSLDKLFIWDVEADAISKVTHEVVVITGTVMDVQNNSIIVTVNINKSNWVYIELTDQYTDIFNLTVETSDGKVIFSDMIWREHGKIYVLDDPDTEYQFAYYYTILTPTFDPTDGAIFNFSNPTITITYNETVIVTRATLNDELINLSTADNKIFIYTLETNLANGSYTLSINVQDTEKNSRTDTAVYTINLEKSEDQPEITPYEESPWIALIVIMIILTVIFLLFKAGYLNYRGNRG